MKYLNIWEELAEDVIAILGDSFKVLLCLRLLTRSPELPTAATPEALFTDVCETLVRDNFAKLKAFRTEKFGACHMTGDEVAAIAEALQPLCVRAWPVLNVMLAMDRDHLFQPRDYIRCMGQMYYEEAASVTFVRFLNDMQRLQEIRSETYERNVSRIAEVHALYRVAKIMPTECHMGSEGRLKPGQTIEAAKWAEVLAVRKSFGLHTMGDLLEEAGRA
ncbi:MAG: hypothetical protein WEB56_00425 [Roseovarius sp.]